MLLLACGKNKVTDNLVTSSSSMQPAASSSLEMSSSLVASSSSAPESSFVNVGKGVLLDDFERGDGVALVGNGWYSWTDTVDGGGSHITNLDSVGKLTYMQPGYFSKKSLSLAFAFNKGSLSYSPYIGFGLVLDRSATSVTSSMGRFGGVSYYYKGAAHSVRVDASDVLDYDVHVIAVPASRVWKKVSFPFTDFKQEGWGKHVVLNKEHITNVSWQVKGISGSADSLQIDNLYLGDSTDIKAILVEDLGTPPAAVIPTVTPLASIAISNPMQTLAQKLDHGINITNWLEEASSPFSSFRYTESDVHNWSLKGFKALRFPVDLDQYLVNKAGYLAGTAPFAIKDSLFIVLDSFDVWTKRNGMSLTIDYHEYDKGFNATTSKNPMYVSMMTRLWKGVAQHFSTSTRDDIFFELYNEPDNTISASVWGSVAQGMIDSIRTVDSTHAIIFGDVSWYGISSIVNRTPFTDGKVIYAIHYYEPFVFTHQGAGWTDVSALHGIPFPYDPTKWFTSSADLGVTSSTLAYVKSQITNYYKTGNKEAQMIQFQKAKAWAVSNNVPLILNEFGVYNVVADNASLLNFYKTITDICTELEIPWQHWGITGNFAVLSTSGEFLPGIKSALGM